MDFWAETHWFAVQAKPFQEKLAAASVAKFDAEVFLPRIKQEQLVCGIMRLLTKPLFSGYFFAQFSPLLLQEAVRYARGVLRIVGTSRLPVPLDAEIISAIQNRVRDDGFIRLEVKGLGPGQAVTIEQRPFAGLMGRVESERDDGKKMVGLKERIEAEHKNKRPAQAYFLTTELKSALDSTQVPTPEDLASQLSGALMQLNEVAGDARDKKLELDAAKIELKSTTTSRDRLKNNREESILHKLIKST